MHGKTVNAAGQSHGHWGHPNEPHPETRGRTIGWARHYDLMVNLLAFGQGARLRRATAALARIKPGDSVLDVGCGTGDLTMAAATLAGPNGEVWGIDAAPEMIEVARAKAARAGAAVDFRVGLIEHIDLPDACCDVVLSSLMMHHLPADLKREGLVEIYRVLKPGATVLIVDFERPQGSFGHAVLRLLPHRPVETGLQDLEALLSEAGFSNVETGPVGFMGLQYLRGRTARQA